MLNGFVLFSLVEPIHIPSALVVSISRREIFLKRSNNSKKHFGWVSTSVAVRRWIHQHTLMSVLSACSVPRILFRQPFFLSEFEPLPNFKSDHRLLWSAQWLFTDKAVASLYRIQLITFSFFLPFIPLFRQLVLVSFIRLTQCHLQFPETNVESNKWFVLHYSIRAWNTNSEIKSSRAFW